MKLGENIRMRRRTCGYTVEELASKLGVSRQTVFRYENGQIATIPHDKLEQLAEILGTTPAVLLGYTDKTVELLSEPLYDGDEFCTPAFFTEGTADKRKNPAGVVAVGAEPPVLDGYADVLPAQRKLPGFGEQADFYFTIPDDSMVGARIHKGDIVFFERAEVGNGDVAAVVYEGTTYIRRFYDYPEEKKIVLIAENPQHAPIVLTGGKRRQAVILGRAFAFQSTIQ